MSILYIKEKRGFPGVSDGKESACNTGDLGLISESGTFPGEGNENVQTRTQLHSSHILVK